MMTTQIDVSFCIPTYNNSQNVKRLVDDILEYKNRNIEIVLLNNSSTDETLEVLQEVKDDRLIVYSNTENMGALFNMVNVLAKGSGKYLVYCTDQDHIDFFKIEKFHHFLLENSEISCGYCDYLTKSNNLFKIYTTGFQSVKELGYRTRHPTGYFFKNDLFKQVKIIERFSDYEYVDLFPLEFVIAELSQKGDAAVYFDSIFNPETKPQVRINKKSATTDGASSRAYFSPKTRLKLATKFEDHIRSLVLSEKEKEILVVDSFFRELYSATLNFKFIMSQKDLCAHYYMETRKINYFDLIRIGYEFYRGYSEEVIRYRYKSMFSRCKFKMLLLMRIIKGASRRMILALHISKSLK